MHSSMYLHRIESGVTDVTSLLVIIIKMTKYLGFPSERLHSFWQNLTLFLLVIDFDFHSVIMNFQEEKVANRDMNIGDH